MTLLLALALVVPNLDGMVRLIGKTSLAHACPLSSDRAITNAHVANESYVWSVGDASGTVAIADRTSPFRDLAWIKPEGGKFPRWFPIAAQPPQPGEELFFVGYDWRKQDQAFAVRVFKVKALRVIGGHLAYKPAGEPGSSGSCVVNSRGEIVAVNAGAIELQDKNRVGVGVAVWGSWLTLGEAK